MQINEKDRIALSKIESYWIDEKSDTGICVTYDSGKFSVLHARNKKDRAERMAEIDEYFTSLEIGG